MGPRRKKSKQTPQNEEAESASSANSLQHKTPQEPEQADTKDIQKQSAAPESPVTPTQQTGNRSSWYKGGSWRAKASPVAQATRESISVAGGATSEALGDGAQQTGRAVHKSLRRSSTKSFPSISAESFVHATGTNAGADNKKSSLDKIRKNDQPKDADTKMEDAPVVETTTKAKDTQAKEADNKPKDGPVKEADIVSKDGPVKAAATTSSSKDLKPLPTDFFTQQPPQQSPDGPAEESGAEPPLPPDPSKDNRNSGWWGWWSRPDGYTDNTEKDKAQDDRKEASSTPLPATPDETANEAAHQLAQPSNINDTLHSNRSVETATSSRSWFRMWSSTQNQQAAQQEHDASPPKGSALPLQPSTAEPTPTEPAQKPVAIDPPPNEPTAPEIKQGQETPTTKSTGWAFWSRANTTEGNATPNGTQKQVGELAVADTPSQSHPEAAQFNEQHANKAKSTKLGRSASISSTASLSSPSQPHVPVSDAGKMPESTKPASDAKTPKSQAHPNLVIPTFDETFSLAYVPSYWERLSTYVASSLRMIDSPSNSNHVFVNPTPPKIKNAIAIGVHGYFPAPLIQKVLGQPTGTSIRFANYASTAIRDWVETNQPETPCEIETVALEGEGFIADRVATLWKLLLNWLSHLRQADLILVACHSQGVPVAIMLVHKLLQLGCLSPHAKIGVCAMAGVNLGPFADYKSRLLGAGAAAELFEFSRQDSRVSSEYKAALDGVLRHGVRITYCGSIDDQLVSMESSTFTTLTHPYINRTVFIDGRLHAPNFLTHLVAFALKLRNLGVNDHGLIRELSLPLAGSLYGGEGHSRIYDDPAVYNLALRFVLETTDMTSTPAGNATEAQERRSSRGGPPSSVSAANSLRRGSVSAATLQGIKPVFADYEVPASGSSANPYFLPWALRGILEEDVVKEKMDDEVKQLVEEFENWKPTSKVLKDVRFRLEGVRSKL